MEKKDTGDRGEALAAAFLQQKGFSILERNWRFKNLEVDIIAQTGNFVVIVEVKTRGTREFGDPASFVNTKKKGHLIRAANFYATEKNIENEFRFDVVSVFLYGDESEIDHYEAAFYPLVNQVKI